jgi:exopolyphosphatase/guanosine-5'-triphosphate,3'-diphosphate pyrophosphatase
MLLANRPIATIDVGTNTALLLVARRSARGGIEVLHDEQRFVRLGEGVDAARRITEAALGRLRAVLLDYGSTAERLGASEVHVVGTSASRDAANRAELIDFVRRETGLRYRVITGEEEARLSFLGARSALADLRPNEVTAVLDIGGGSTELVVGDATALSFRHSYDVGAVRYTERLFRAQPPSPASVAEARRLLAEAFAAPRARIDAGRTRFVGAAGTAAALALLDAGAGTWPELEAKTGSAVYAMRRDAVSAWADRLACLTEDEVLALGPEIMTGRADVFPLGVLILEAAMQSYDFADCSIVIRSLRHGLALEVVGR